MNTTPRFVALRVADNADTPRAPQCVVVDASSGPLPTGDALPTTTNLRVAYVGPLFTEAEAAVIAEALEAAYRDSRLELSA